MSNAGPSDATSVSVVDTLPAGVTFVSAVGHGLVVRQLGERLGDVHAGVVRGGGVDDDHDRGDGSGPGRDADELGDGVGGDAGSGAGNNSSSVSTTVTGLADLSVVKSGPPTVTAAGSVTYSLLVANAGPSDAVGVSVVDVLPAGVTFVSAGGTGWSCTNSGNASVTCTAAGVGVGGDGGADQCGGDGAAAGCDVDQCGIGVVADHRSGAGEQCVVGDHGCDCVG